MQRKEGNVDWKTEEGRGRVVFSFMLHPWLFCSYSNDPDGAELQAKMKSSLMNRQTGMSSDCFHCRFSLTSLTVSVHQYCASVCSASCLGS